MVRHVSKSSGQSASGQQPAWWQESSEDRRELWKAFGPAIGIGLAGFAIAWLCMAPAPPKEVTIAAGSRDGAYYQYCIQYAECLARNDIKLNIVETKGSVENYQLLMHDADVDLAIVQGGTSPTSPAAHNLQSIASLYPEPLWIFCRGEKELSDLRELQGQRVAVGPTGSGTRCMADQILSVNGMDQASRSLKLDDRTGSEAADALKRGELDAAFFVTAVDAPYIKELIHSPDVRLLNLQRQQAYAQLYPWLQPITLAQGVVNLQADLPPEDIAMIAPAASLVASPDLHDAFVPLFLKAAEQIHGSGGMFVRPGDFPSARQVEHPLNRSAAEYFEHGPSLLDRYLPFWVASLISRTRILLVPLLTLMIPLIRLTPPIYRWRIRSRIYRWYEVLRRIDQDLSDPNANRSILVHRAELERMETELREINVPLSYMEEFYNLRQHIELVSRRVSQQQSSRAA